jgi:hypothetical protein
MGLLSSGSLKFATTSGNATDCDAGDHEKCVDAGNGHEGMARFRTKPEFQSRIWRSQANSLNLNCLPDNLENGTDAWSFRK